MKTIKSILIKHGEIRAIPIAGVVGGFRERKLRLRWWTGELKALIDHYSLRHLDISQTRHCRRCNGEYAATYYRRPKNGTSIVGWCSTQCMRDEINERRKLSTKPKPSRAKPRVPMACTFCQITFTPPRNDAKFCSTNCRVKAFNRRRGVWAKLSQ